MHVVPLLLGHLVGVAEAQDAGHIAQDVEPSERVDGRLHGGKALRALRHVEVAHLDGPAGVFDQGLGPGQTVVIDVHREDPGPLGRQAHADGPSDAGSRSRDQRNLVFESSHLLLPSPRRTAGNGVRSRALP